MKKRVKSASHFLRPRSLLPKSPVSAVRAVWILAVLWYELGAFRWDLAGCRWPDAELDRVLKDEEDSSSSISLTHVLLIADPQIRAPRRHPAWRRWLHLTDLALRKRWSFVRRVRPDVVVFLGDMLDRGRYADDDEYRESFEYFKSIFSVEPDTKVYYVPGNHDIGLGPSSRMNTAHARRRYTKYFGPLNNKVSIANHTLIMLDSPGLADEDYRRAGTGKSFEDWQAIPGGTIDFINSFAGVGSEEPVVLFSHIPLFRPDTAGCGALRERGNIRRGVGHGFQNMLMRDTTRYILRYVRPAVVFSGNDHDYCEYTHSIPLLSEGPEAKIDYVREVTVKAISSIGDIRRPGFQLLSLSESSIHQTDGKTFADAPCFLPGERDIYFGRYLPLLILSLFVLLATAIRRHWPTWQRSGGSRQDLDTNPDMNETLPLSAAPHDDSSKEYLDPTTLYNSGRTAGSSSLAPMLRAHANGQFTPHTPDFSVGGSVPREFRTSAQAAYVASGSEDTEGDEEIPEQMTRYRGTSDKGSDYLRLTLDRARRKRRLAWTWTFELGGRRRRLVVGVPFLMEHVARTFWRATVSNLRGGHANRSGTESILLDFLISVLVAGWPSIFLLCIIYFVLLR
ncbi:hypothetical protein ACEPAI_7685 [Sanghuangporus weigelae]